MRSFLPQDHPNFYLSQTAAARRLSDYAYSAIVPGPMPMPQATVPNFTPSQKLREDVDLPFQRRSEYILPGAPFIGQGFARQPSATCNPVGLNMDGAPFIGQRFQPEPPSGSSHGAPFQQHSQSPQGEVNSESWQVPAHTLHFDRVSAETQFTIQPTSSSLYGALGNGFQDRSTTVVTTPAPPLPQTQHNLPVASAPTIDPPAPGAMPIIPSTTTSTAPTAVTFSLPQEAKKTNNHISSQGNGRPQSSPQTVSRKRDRQESGPAKFTGVSKQPAGSGNPYPPKIPLSPVIPNNEEETEKSADDDATKGFRIIRLPERPRLE